MRFFIFLFYLLYNKDKMLYKNKMIGWDKMDLIINNLNPKIEKDEIICNHDALEIDGFLTCKLCGLVLSQIFKAESNDYGFKEEKKVFKTKYSQINEIKKHFLNFTIISQIKIKKSDYRKFVEAWNLKNYYQVNKKNVMLVLKECNLELTNILKYYNIIKNKKNNCYRFTNFEINFIFRICVKFIAFYKGIIKNINKKCLIFTICKQHYNILIYEYVGFTHQKIINCYEEHYFSFQTYQLLNFLKHYNLTR